MSGKLPVCKESEQVDWRSDRCSIALLHAVLPLAARSQIDGRPGVLGKCQTELIARDLRLFVDATMKNDWSSTLLTASSRRILARLSWGSYL